MRLYFPGTLFCIRNARDMAGSSFPSASCVAMSPLLFDSQLSICSHYFMISTLQFNIYTYE